MNKQLTNGTLYNETLYLYHNRHRKLTISRIVRETGLPWNFVSGITQRVPKKSDDKLKRMNEHLKKYANNPHLL